MAEGRHEAPGVPDANRKDQGHELPTVMIVAELAAFMRVDRKTIYDLIAAGKLPGARRCGRSVRIHRDTILRWLAEGQH